MPNDYFMEALVDLQRHRGSVAKRSRTAQIRTHVTLRDVLGLYKETDICDHEYIRRGGDMIKLSTMTNGSVGSNIPRYVVYTALKGFGFGLFCRSG